MNRPAIACALAGVIGLGAASRLAPLGLAVWDKSAGDVAYAVMVGLLLLLARPRTKPRVVGALAIAICFAVEIFQLTGIPARAPRVLRVALGTTFAWHDMACYVVGGLVLTAGLMVVARRAR